MINDDILSLEASIKVKSKEMNTVKMNRGDIVDIASASQQHLDDTTDINRMNSRLDQLKKALKNKDLGICESCSDDINPKRMLALPTSTECITCAEHDYATSARR